jgi:phage terminase large subunit-like protein
MRGHLALWMREMECEVIPEGGATFNPENLKYWDVLPEGMVYVLAIDPASSDSKTADDQVIGVIGFYRSDVYLVEYSAEKGEMPEMAGIKVIEYARRYKLLGGSVESTSYQRVLAHYLEQVMRETKTFLPIHRVDDRRKKSDRIIQAIGSTAGYGRLYVKPTMSKFLAQYNKYSPTAKMHDDVLDMLAQGIDYGNSLGVATWDDWIDGEFSVVTDGYERKKVEFRSCP